MPKVKKQTWMADPVWDDATQEAVTWCISNNILIAVRRKGDEYLVEAAPDGDYKNYKGNGKTYSAEEAWEVLGNYAVYYHDKYSKEKKGNSRI